jgi:hypothetical protein
MALQCEFKDPGLGLVFGDLKIKTGTIMVETGVTLSTDADRR